MAMIASGAGKPAVKPITPDTYERGLAIGAVILLLFVVVAIARGYGEWSRVPLTAWAHLATMAVALVLTPIMLLRPRGTRVHRQLGRIWTAAMILTAAISLFIANPNLNRFSFIHILSIVVLVQVPLLVHAARTHNIRRHRIQVRAMVTGALLIAGFFTFPFDRLLGHWLFG